MADANILLTANEEQFLRAIIRASEEERRFAKTIEETGKAGDRASLMIEKGMSRAGKQSVSEFDQLLRELRKTGPEGRKQAADIEKHLQETGKQGRRSMQTIVTELEKIDPAAAEVARNVKQEFKEVGEEIKESVGQKAISNVAKFAAGWISVSTAIGLAKDALGRVRQEQEKALASLEQQSDPNKRLLQVSTDEEDFRKLTSKADDLAMRYGIGRDEARSLMFSGRSEGFEESADFIASNAQVLGVSSQATVAGQIPGLFQNEGLRAEEAINMGLVAAAESRLNFEEIARAMPGAAEGGALAGAGSAETFGALSVLAGRFKSGDTAADRLKAFTSAVGLDKGISEDDARAATEANKQQADIASKQLRTLEERLQDSEARLQDARKKGDKSSIERAQLTVDRNQRSVNEFDRSKLVAEEVQATAGLSGSGIVDAVKKLQSMSEADRKAFLGGSKEINAAYVILVEEFDKIQDRIATIEGARQATGTDQSAVTRRRQIAQNDPQLRALQQKRAAENRREIANERRNAEKEARRRSRQDTTVAGALNRGENEFTIVAGEIVSDGLRGVGADGMAANALESFAGGDLSALQRSASAGMETSFIRNRPTDTASRALSALNVGASMLSQQDQSADPGVLGELSRDQSATFLRELTGKQVELQQITPEIQAEITRQIRAAAMANTQRTDSDFTGLAASLGGGARADAAAILPEVKIDRLISLMEQTAGNTSPANRPPNYSTGLQAGAAGAALP